MALATAVLLASLSLVAWRQARALESLESLDGLRREWTLAQAEREELELRVHEMESRGRIVPEARRRLGMRIPEAAEIVLLPGDAS